MKKLFENWNRYLNLSENEPAEMTPDQVLASSEGKIGEGDGKFKSIIDYVWELWKDGRIPSDYSGHGPDEDYTALDQDYTRKQNITRQAHEEQRAEIGNIRDYFIDLHNDREAQSWAGSKAIHKAKSLDDARRSVRGLPLNPGGGSLSYRKWIIIPNSEPLENPSETDFHPNHPTRGDKAFKRNAKLPHKEINVDEFKKQDLQKRIERLSGTGESQ